MNLLRIRIYLFFLFVVPIVLLVLPADYFDQGQTLCLSVLLFDHTCYGCGMTRAIQHLLHLEIQSTIAYNKLAFVVLPLAMLAWCGEVKRIRNRLKVSAIPSKEQ